MPHPLIAQEAEDAGHPILEVIPDPDDPSREVAYLGRFEVIYDDEDQYLFVGEEGPLTLAVVGSPIHRNERAAYFFAPEGADPTEVVDPFAYLQSV